MPGTKRSRRASLAALPLATALAVAPGCHYVGKGANDAFEWGGRVFTTNPGSVAPYFMGFGLFFVAGLPLDLFSWVATSIGWNDGSGPDYQASCLAPSIFMGVAGGTILGLPFFPFGLPWWDPDDSAPDPEPPKQPVESKKAEPSRETPASSAKPAAPEKDTSPTAGAPGR
jgi:hypothetical protein